MGFFNWAAPVFHHVADRWTDDDIRAIAGNLRPAAGACARLLDVGGGTGALALRLAEALDAHATVLDPTPQMLRYVPEHPRVTALVGTAEAMPLPDDEFDALIVCDALHHFRDPAAAAREFTRVVRTGGRVVILELDPTVGLMPVVVLAEKLLGEPATFFTPEDLTLLMEARGISGTCAREGGASYRFVAEIL